MSCVLCGNFTEREVSFLMDMIQVYTSADFSFSAKVIDIYSYEEVKKLFMLRDGDIERYINQGVLSCSIINDRYYFTKDNIERFMRLNTYYPPTVKN